MSLRSLLLLASAGLLACTSPAGTPADPVAVAEASGTAPASEPSVEQPQWPVDDSPVVARSGTAVVRGSRLLLAGRFQQWLDQWAPPDRAVESWWQSDARIRSLLGSELEYAVLAEEVERLGIAVTSADVDAQIASVEPLARLAALPETERDAAYAGFAPLDWRTARNFAVERARMQAWIERHATLPSDDVLREEWLRANDRVSIDVVVVPNRHPDAEIGAFVDAHRDRIETEYAANPDRYTSPSTVTINEFAVAPTPDEAAFRRRCEQLDEHAARVLLGDGDSAPPEGYVQQVRTVQRNDMPEAFGHAEGTLVDPVVRDGVCSRFVVLTRTPRMLRLLDDDLARQIGAEMLAREAQNPESERLARAIQISFDNPAAIDAHGFVVTRTPPFARNSEGHVAGVGNAPALHDAIFTLLREPGDQLPGPWFTTYGWVALRLVERTTATAADFPAARDAFAQTWLDIVRRTVWPRFLQQRAAEQPATIDVETARAYLAAYFDAVEGSR